MMPEKSKILGDIVALIGNDEFKNITISSTIDGKILFESYFYSEDIADEFRQKLVHYLHSSMEENSFRLDKDDTYVWVRIDKECWQCTS